MLKIGEKVPDFTADSSQGGTLGSADLSGNPYVLYFYPKSFTPGCTIETREFAKATPDIEALGAKLVGVSIDKLDTQCKFSDELGADFPILADPKGEISKKFGVKRMMLPIAKRVTYVVDEQGKVEAAFHMDFKYKEHIQMVLDHLKSR